MYNFFPFRMPYLGFPYYKNYYAKHYYKNSFADQHEKNPENNKNSTTNDYDSSTINNNQNCCEQPIFNILGLDIYNDDILIFCILFSLYTEGIKDEMLFICLLLLLLS